MISFAGQWFTTFGPMSLKQTGAKVSGTYQMGPEQCTLTGEVKGGRLRFTYRESSAEGEGWFDLQRPGKFQGQWRAKGSERWSSWSGTRGFEGIWDSTFGPMRLMQDNSQVQGCYECTGHATIEGALNKNRLEFRYREPEVEGTGWFDLSADGERFEGQWKKAGTRKWSEWKGTRVKPSSGVTWLVVMEAHWQAHLKENEYAFGHMLREFFARVPGVRVRQRFFSNAHGLQKWCRDVTYLAEPVYVVIASHGTQEGLRAHDHVIDGAVLADTLRYADSLQLLHFSACLLMEKLESAPWYLSLKAQFPISGYTTSVDWAASALIEFLYLDMILSKGLPPDAAAAKIPTLMPFATATIEGSPYPAAGFRFLPGSGSLAQMKVDVA